MQRSELIARLDALHKAVGRLLQNPMHQYFDPAEVLEFFERWRSILEEIKEEFPQLYADLPLRRSPAPSGTSDFGGRGYLTRAQMERLLRDMQYILDAIAAFPAVVVPSMKVTREGVFFAGQYFDAFRDVSELIATAQRRVALVDGYVNSDTLAVLSGKVSGTLVQILTKDASASLQVAAQAFAKQFGGLEIRLSQAFHDRFLFIDDSEVYHFGASIKDLGHRGFMFSRVEEPDVLNALRAKFDKEWLAARVVIRGEAGISLL